MPRNRKIPLGDADDGDIPSPLPNSSNDEATGDLANPDTSNTSDHVVNIEATGQGIEVSKAVGIFGKPMGLKPDPDLKRKWGEIDSTDKTNIRKVTRFLFKGSVPPWKSLLAVFVWSFFVLGISIGAAFVWPAQRRNACRFIVRCSSPLFCIRAVFLHSPCRFRTNPTSDRAPTFAVYPTMDPR